MAVAIALDRQTYFLPPALAPVLADFVEPVRLRYCVSRQDVAFLWPVKLPKDEAAAVVATDPTADPTGYGLGRHGWISVSIPTTTSAKRWREIEEWIRTSYTLVAPNKLARAVLEEDQQPQ